VLPGDYCLTQKVVQCLIFRHLPCGCPTSTLTTYVSKGLNRNIRMLIENYHAIRKRSETNVKKELICQERKWHHFNHG
jgi:hypothetical protein